MSKYNKYIAQLMEKVIDKSQSHRWGEAVAEWEIVDCSEDKTATETCICGKENIRYLFTIQNSCNGNELFPIGSTCIEQFGRSDLKEAANVQRSMFRLFHAVEQDKFIELSTELFSKKILKELYDKGAFIPTHYNGNDGERDYKFILQMFNKKNKADISRELKGKISAILLNSIIPYLKRELAHKILKAKEAEE